MDQVVDRRLRGMIMCLGEDRAWISQMILDNNVFKKYLIHILESNWPSREFNDFEDMLVEYAEVKNLRWPVLLPLKDQENVDIYDSFSYGFENIVKFTQRFNNLNLKKYSKTHVDSYLNSKLIEEIYTLWKRFSISFYLSDGIFKSEWEKNEDLTYLWVLVRWSSETEWKKFNRKIRYNDLKQFIDELLPKELHYIDIIRKKYVSTRGN